MNEFLQHLKQHKLVQWAVAYIAFAFALIQVLDVVSDSYAWPRTVMHIVFGLLALGFVVMLVLAWYHGERGAQRLSGGELLIVALLLAIGGGLLWRFARSTAPAVATTAQVATNAPGGTARATAPSAAVSTATRASVSHTAVTSPVAAPIPAKSVAVLPFENLSTDKGNAYFADGMQDLILTKLADIGDLKVISRTSTLQYGSRPENLKLVGQQLGVAAILEGSVQKAGKQVLINVQLIDARTDAHIWAKSYQRTLDNIFGVEGEVAGKVAQALNAKLTTAQASAVAAVPTRNPQAFDAYLRGEGYVAQADAGAFATAVPKGVAAYQQAVDQDPTFALAWAKLALTQSLLMYASIDTSDATRRKALANAQHALQLAPNLPQAHLALGYVYRFDFADYTKALTQFEIARKDLPNNAEVEAAIAYLDDMRGDTKAAAEALQRATVLDPRNPNLAFSLGQTLTRTHRYQRASSAFQRALAVAPNDPEAYAALAWLKVLAQGDADAALAELAKAPAAIQTDPPIVAMRVQILLLQHDYSAARLAVADLKGVSRFVTPMRVALLRARVSHLSGDAAGARKGYERVLALAKAIVSSGGENAITGYSSEAMAEASLGHKAEALHALAQGRAFASNKGLSMKFFIMPRELATIYVILGDNDQAVAALQKAFAGPRDAAFARLILHAGSWEPLRKDPRFQALLKKYARHAPAVTHDTLPAVASS